MGFFIKKTIKAGMFNLNLSNSGIGSSFGIKGLRFGIDSKGRSYIDGGRGMLRYREYFHSTKRNLYSKNSESTNSGCGCAVFLILILFFIVDTKLGMSVIIVILYLLPGIIGYLCNFSNRENIFLLNLLLGWTIIGYIISYMLVRKNFKEIESLNTLEKKFINSKNAQIEETLNELINKNPSRAKEYKLIALEIYKENKDYQKALDMLNSSNLGDTRQLKMYFLQELGQYEEVIDILQKDFTQKEKDEHPILYAFWLKHF